MLSRYFFFCLYIFVFSFLSSAIAEDKVNASSFNEIIFADDMWSDEFLSIANTEPTFLSKNMVFPIPPAYSNDSSETQEELRVLHYYADHLRTPEQIEKIILEQQGSSDLVFGLGADVPANVLYAVSLVRSYVTNDAAHFIYRAKGEYKRARPTQLDPELSLVIPVPGSPAYPSGHATIAWLGGRTFSYIDPANQSDYMRYAGDVGMRRAISGIHYPSDSVAGRILADQIFDALLENKDFRAEIDNVKALYQSTNLAQKNIDLDAIRFLEEEWDKEFLGFLDTETVFLNSQLVFDIPPPPANSSNETMLELTQLREYSRTYRTPDQINLIKREAIASGDYLGGGALIDPFMQNLKFSQLWGKVYADSAVFLIRAKHKFQRPRPSHLVQDLTTVVAVPGHASYPSGHAFDTRMLAHLMGAVDTDNAQIFLEKAYKIGHRREIAGLHYPSDTKAGILLADLVWEELLKVPDFLKAIKEVRAEHEDILQAAELAIVSEHQ